MAGKKSSSLNQRCREIQRFWQTVESSPDYHDVKNWVCEREGWNAILSLARSKEPDVTESDTFPVEWLNVGNRSLIGVLSAFKKHWMPNPLPEVLDDDSGQNLYDKEPQTQTQPQSQPAQPQQHDEQKNVANIHGIDLGITETSTRPETGIGGFGIEDNDDISPYFAPLKLSKNTTRSVTSIGGGITRHENMAQSMHGSWNRRREEERVPFRRIEDGLPALPLRDSGRHYVPTRSPPRLESEFERSEGAQTSGPSALLRWWTRGARERRR